MKSKPQILAVTLSVALLFVVYLGVRAGAVMPYPQIEAPRIQEIQGGLSGATPFRKYEGGFFCDVLCFQGEQAVKFKWRFAPGYQMGDEPLEKSIVVPVRFWPNYAEWLNDTELLVAGVEPSDGATVIEVWTFEATAPQFPNLENAQGDNGPFTLWSLPKRRAVRKVFESKDPATMLVSYAKENLGAPGRAFVRFAGSGNLYDLELQGPEGALTLVASATAVPGALHIPELGGPGPWIIGGSAVLHDTEGFVFGLMTDFSQAAPISAITLIDSNYDGVLEDYTTDLSLVDYYFGSLVREVH